MPDRDRPFGPRGGPMGRGGPLDDFPDGPRGLMDRRFGHPEDFDRMGPTRPEIDFDMRHGPPPHGDPDFDVRGLGGPDRFDEFDRQARYEFEMRSRNAGDRPPFDFPRGMPDDFDLRDHPDFDPRGGRRDFFMDKFGPPGMMGQRGPRGPHPPMMGGPDGFGPRGGRGGPGKFYFFLLFCVQ